MRQKSEFGKGLTYCLALFLCHSERDYLMLPDDKDREACCRPHLWFYGAADHIYELQIPKTLPPPLFKRLLRFKDKVMNWRMVMDKAMRPTKDDRVWAINEAKELIRLIDNFMGIKTGKAQWL